MNVFFQLKAHSYYTILALSLSASEKAAKPGRQV